jgi:hypothetical protein
MRAFLQTRVLASAVAGACAVAAHAQSPRIWTWDLPRGQAAGDPAYTALVMPSVQPSSTPESVADAVSDTIRSRGLTPGRVGILPFLWGRGTLVGNPGDAASSPLAPPGLRTPWTAAGRVQMAAWMDRFIARYQARQAVDGIPSPDRWHLDCELRMPALCYLPNVDPCWGTDPVQLFAALRDDPRWDAEPLLLNPGGTPTPRTLADAWAAARSPAADPALPRDHPSNRPWSIWWDAVTREATDGALHEVFYSRVRTAWPLSRCSEFAQTLRLDGGSEPDGGIRDYVDFEWWNRGWMRSAWTGRGDLQAPAIYVFGETFLDPAAGVWRENMRLHRANVDACLHSYGGVDPSTVTPWVTMPRIPLPFGLDGSNRAVSDDEFLEIAAMLRGRGIDEFMLWPGGDEATWDATHRGIRAAWDVAITSATVTAGTAPADALGSVRRADRVPLAVAAGASGIELRATFVSPAPAPGRSAGRLWVAIECSAAASQVSVEARRSDASGWRPLGTFAAAPSLPGARWLGPFDADGIVGTGGSIEIRIRSADSLDVDLLQVARDSASDGTPRSPDIDDDGRVSGSDLGILLGDWSLPGGRSDLDGDGTVGGSDLGVLLGAWAP